MAQMLRVPLLATLPSLSLHLLASWGALPTHPCHHPKGSWTKSVHGSRNGGDTCSITWTSTHPGWPGYSHCWVPNLPVTETKTLYSTIHHGDHLAMLWQVYYTGLLPSWRSSTFFFFFNWKKTLTLDTGLPSLLAILLPKLLFVVLYYALSTVMYSHSISSDLGTLLLLSS